MTTTARPAVEHATTGGFRRPVSLDTLTSNDVRDLRWLTYEVLAVTMIYAIDAGDGGRFRDVEDVVGAAWASGALGSSRGDAFRSGRGSTVYPLAEAGHLVPLLRLADGLLDDANPAERSHAHYYGRVRRCRDLLAAVIGVER